MAENKKITVVDVKGNTVKVRRETRGSDDKNAMLTQTFDFNGIDRDSELRYMVEDRLIAWRSSGVRKLTSDALVEKYDNQTIHVKDAFPRVVVQLTPEEQKLRDLLVKLHNKGKSVEEIEAMLMDEGETTS